MSRQAWRSALVGFWAILQRLGAARLAFLGSLVLSLVAVQGAVLNRDGMLYVDTARVFLEQGLAAARAQFDWLFLPLLLAAGSAVTGLGPETVGLVLNGLLFAGCCALLVALSERLFPGSAWVACLVVLALPAFNAYRADLIREPGYWFFCVAALWLALRWADSGRLREAFACQLALCAAVLFRLEAAAFFAALVLWQLSAAPAGKKLRGALMVAVVPLAALVLFGLMLATGLISLDGRFSYYLELLDPMRKLSAFSEAANRVGEGVLNKYSQDEAGSILFFGLLSVVPVKFVQMSGIFLVPLTYLFVRYRAGWVLARWQLLGWVFMVYFLVLVAFLTHQFFLTGRYVSFLNLLAVPLVAAGLLALMEQFPRWKGVMVALAVLVMLANVVSIGPRKTHYVEAGEWLAANVADASRVYVENPRVSYYAGWGYARAQQAVQEREAVAQALAEGRLAMAVLEVGRTDSGLDVWMARHDLQPGQRFVNAAGDAVVLVVRGR